MRAAIYTRISDDHTGEELGVQRQLDDCTALAERLGWEAVARYDDNDISAYSGWHSADCRSLVPSNPALQNPCGGINPTPHEPPGSHRNPLALNLLDQ
jgi:hypothetical protein